MHWNRWYAAKSYLRSAVWTVPLIALLLEQVAIRVVSAIDSFLDWVPRLATTATGTSAVMDTVVNLAIAFIVFTFGSMLVAIQVAGGQMTPGSSRQRCCATTSSDPPSGCSSSHCCSPQEQKHESIRQFRMSR